MADSPWLADACSLVDAYRAGERSPAEELDATLGAIERSELNAVPFLDVEAAREAAERADVDLPFGGVPMLVKELDQVAGWPANEASIPLKDRVASFTSIMVSRAQQRGGAVLAGQSSSSEFGGINWTTTKLHGATHNPWKRGHTPGGSSGGAAAAVAGGLVTIGTGGDGGGSIRIPAGFCGLPGLKTTYGRIPRGPHVNIGSITVTTGCLSRSVRDIARWLDVCSGPDLHDPHSLPRIDGWERDLGTRDLKGMKAVIAPDLGNATVRSEVMDRVVEHAEFLAKHAGLELVDFPVALPELAMEWALAGLAEVKAELGDRYPDCKGDLTLEIGFGLTVAEQMYNLDGRVRIESSRTRTFEAMADLFSRVDFVFASTNPDVAFNAEGSYPMFDGNPGNHGSLTIPSNIYGNPAITIPSGEFDGLPVGMQVLAPHHRDALLLDLALIAERERPWPLVAPTAPC